MTLALRLLSVAGTGFLLNLGLLPLIIYLAHRNQWYDEKNHRKIHTEDTPRLGGIGTYVSLLAAIAVAFITSAEDVAGMPANMTGVPGVTGLILHFLPFVLGLSMIFVMGLIDDFRDLRAVVKFVIQIAAALLVTLGPFRIESLTVPFIWYQIDLGLFSYPVTVFWIVAVANAVNFIDGVDGLAGGSSAIAALGFAIIAAFTGQGVLALIAFGLFGSLVAFLVFNSPPARIFMGDGGSYVLGFALAVFPLILANGSGNSLDLLPAITILTLPIMDVATSSFRRMHRGTHPFSADREHIHHKLIDLGLGEWALLGVVYGSGVIFSAAAFTWYVLPVNLSMSILLTVWIVVGVLVILLTRNARGTSKSDG